MTGRVTQFPRKPLIRKWLPPDLNDVGQPLLPNAASLVAQRRRQAFCRLLVDVSKHGTYYRDGTAPHRTPWLRRVKKQSPEAIG